MTILFAWDLHGTLIKDAEHHFADVCNRIFPEFNIRKKLSGSDVALHWGKPLDDVLHSILPKLDNRTKEKLVKRFMQEQWKVGTHHIKPMDHAGFVLQTIKNTGNMNIVVANTRKNSVWDFIEWAGLQDYIEHAIGLSPEETAGGFHSGEVKGLKIKRFAQQHRANKVILIGDSEDDVEAGKVAKAYTIFFNPAGKPVPKGADRAIGDLRMVLDVLPATRI